METEVIAEPVTQRDYENELSDLRKQIDDLNRKLVESDRMIDHLHASSVSSDQAEHCYIKLLHHKNRQIFCLKNEIEDLAADKF